MIMAGRSPLPCSPQPGAGAYQISAWMGQPVSTALGGPRVIRSVRMVRGRRLAGLGQNCMSSSDIAAAMNCPQMQCGTTDEQCIACKTQCANAISDAVDSGCIAPGTPISWACDTSAASIYGSTGQTGTSDATVGTGSGAYVATGPVVTGSMQTPATPNTTATGSNNTTQNSQVYTSSSGQSTNTSGPAPPQSTRPWYRLYQLSRYGVQSTIVNPSPSTQTTNGSTSAASSSSAVSQANGTTTATTGTDLLSTVAGYVNSYPDIISGLDNSTLLTIVAIGGAALLFYAASKGR